MDKNQIIKWLAVAGGAYAVYWYITTRGPGGNVAEGHPSYWDTWFGTAVTVPAGSGNTTIMAPGYQTPVQSQPQLPAPSGNQTPVVIVQTPAGPVATPVAPVSTTKPTVRDAVMAAAMAEINGLCDGNANNCLNADQWSYYYTKATGIPQTADLFNPANRGELISIDTYFQRRTAAGLSGIGDIIPVQSVSSVPSMSFGSNMSGYGRPAKPGHWSGGGSGGGYLQ